MTRTTTSDRGGTGDTGPPDRFVTPPWRLLLLATLTLLTSLALLFQERFGAHLVGYLLSGVGAVGLVAAYRRTDTRRRSNPFYSPMAALARARADAVIAFLAFAIATSHAWAIATQWSR